MAPKRRANVVMRSTKKIFKETVKVAVVQKPEGDSGDQESLETLPFDSEDIAEDEERVFTQISVEGFSNDKAQKDPHTVQVPVEAPAKNQQQTEQVPAEEEPRKDEAQKEQKTHQIPLREPSNEAPKGMEEEQRDEALKALEEEPSNEAGEQEQSNEAPKGLQEEPNNKTSKALELDEPPTPLQKEAERKGKTCEGEQEVLEQKKEKTKGAGEEEKKGKSREGKESNENIGKRKRGKRKEFDGNETYKTFVFRVLKQVHPGMTISSKAMSVINSLMNDMFERIANEATNLSKYTERKTLSSKEIQGAVRLVLPGELGKHAVAEDSKAVTNYASYNAKRSKSD
ncbi:hypothetical protein REPUB_Repub11eG0144100 [Reevesia pubescens]